jgi:hypothetical protein
VRITFVVGFVRRRSICTGLDTVADDVELDPLADIGQGVTVLSGDVCAKHVRVDWAKAAVVTRDVATVALGRR